MVIDCVVERANMLTRLDRTVKRAARVNARTTHIVCLTLQIKERMLCLLEETCAGKVHKKGRRARNNIFAKVYGERKVCYGCPDNDEKLNMKMYV